MEGGGEHSTGMAAPKTKVWGLKCLKKKKKSLWTDMPRHLMTGDEWCLLALLF